MEKTQQSAIFLDIAACNSREIGGAIHTLFPVAVRFSGINSRVTDRVRNLHNGLHVWIRSLRNVFVPLFCTAALFTPFTGADPWDKYCLYCGKVLQIR